MMPVSKLEAAQRQLDCAIRLYFDEEDSLAVHTLSRAAFRVVFDIYPTISDDGLAHRIDGIIRDMGWKQFNQAANFLKHAVSDPDAVQEIRELDTQFGIGVTSTMLGRLTGVWTAEMSAFDFWMKIMNPDIFNVPSDPIASVDEDYRNALALLKSEPQTMALTLGKSLLTFFRDNPDALKPP